MYNEHFGFPESPFRVTPDSRFFFVNPCYEEAFATLRYGIDARKGFVIVTGEAGTGKTTLLKRLTHGLDSQVSAVCIFDPHLSFNQLLQTALSDLGVKSVGEDRLTMMRRLYDFLVEQLERDQVVALMVDEAQSLSIAMLEELRLLSNLETDTEKLLQIVLVGQPEFEEKLDRPELIQLKQRVALRCRLRPLAAEEVGLYIESRLTTVGYSRRGLFDAEAIARLAHYSRGIPRLINVLCDNACLIACINSKSAIGAVEIDEAAHELRLAGEAAPAAAIKNAAEKNPAAHPWELRGPLTTADFPAAKYPAWKDAPAPAPPPEFDRPFAAGAFYERARERANPARAWVLCGLIAATALLIGVQQQPAIVPAARQSFEKLAALLYHEEPVSVPDSRRAEDSPPAPAPAPAEEPAPRPSSLDGGAPLDEPSPPAVEPEPAPEPKAAAKNPPAKRAADVAENKRMVFKRSAPPVPPAGGEIAPARRLQIDVYKAIRDRAIDGVRVAYVDDGTVYLEGRVATPRQKLAAVRATLSVPGVKGVRDRITIDY